MTEAALQRKVRKALKKRFGGRWWKNTGGPFAERGLSDIMGICKTVFFAIETKRPGTNKKPTQEQLDFIQEVKADGGVAFWSNDFNDIVRRVERALYKRGKI